MDYNELFTYNAETGDLTWKPRPEHLFSKERFCRRWNTRYAGTVAGCLNTGGYVQVLINKRPHLAHRVIWEMENGPIPEGGQIDHINGTVADNRRSNLRLATRSQNCRNRKLNKNNKHRLKGVYRLGNAFAAQIRVGGVNHYLGYFGTKGLAAVAYAKAAIRYHGQFARIT